MKHGAYVCGAGVTHYDRASTVERWRKAEEARAAGAAADKVRAHDDYMEGMARFRAGGIGDRIPTFPDGSPVHLPSFEAGYQWAIRRMDQGLMDALAARAQEETNDAR